MNREKMKSTTLIKSLLLSGFLVLSGLFSGCSEDSPVVEEIEEEPQLPVPYSVEVKDGRSDMPSGGGVITAQYADFTTGCDVGKMVDRKPETNYEVSKNTFYILWTCSKSAYVNLYSLTAAVDAPESDPKSWSLSGSNDKKQWILLDEQNNQQFTTRGEVKEYAISNEEIYKYYKLEIKVNNGGATTQIAEWAMQLYSVEVVDGIPEMPPGGGVITPQYAFFTSGCDVGNMVDRKPETSYEVPYKTFYILWSGSKSVLVNHYSLTSAVDAPESDPQSWTFYGSNDKKGWTSLDVQANQEFTTRGEVKEYAFTNEKEYKYFKLDIQSNHGAATTKIAEWGMQEIYTDIDELMQYASGSSYSALTPMGNHYANRHVTTEDDRLWLQDPANEPPAPGSASHLSLAEFPVNLYPYEKPLPADVNQHAVGDCGGLAAMASMAYVYPDFVVSLIKDNGDKTYTVSMFDPQGEPVNVTVTNRFLTGNGSTIDAVSGKNNKATWSTVLEKAIMKYNVVYKVNTDIGGIGSEHVIPLFTGDGNSFAFSPGKLTGKQLARVVNVCLTQGKLIIGGFNKGDLPVDGSKTVTGHAYTLMHSSDRNALFAMRNPWGGNPVVDGATDGVLNIPNNSLIPPTIDFRIVDPGKAANYGNGITEPYIPPTLKSTDMQMRVASYLLNPTNPFRD